jgi:hypothetical protein
MAGWMIIAGSILVVATVFETVTNLRTLETREAVAQFLSQPPGAGLGLDVSGALLALRTVSMVAAGCAAVAAVLGFHVLRRNRSARVGVTVLAVPLFLTGMVTGGFLSSLVAASALLLWLEPSRNWFDGVPAADSSGRGGTTTQRGTWPPPLPPTPAEPPAQPTVSGPPPHQGFGTAPIGPVVPARTRRPERRPAAVLWACVLTWVLCGLAVLMMGLSALVIALEPQLVFEELRRQNPDLSSQGLTDRAVQVATYVTAGVTIVWALVAAVLAVLVVRRVGWARIALLASAAAAGAVCLVASLGSVVMIAPAFGCAVAFALLLRPEVRAWFGPARPAAHDAMHP